MSDWWGIIWLAVLLLVNAFFVAAEFAVISARRSQIEPKAEGGSRAARTSLWAMEHATMMLAACQLGITVCSLLILNVSEPAIHHLLAVPLALTGLGEDLISALAFLITLTIVSFLHVVFGEMVPKNISFSLPDRAILLLAPPLVLIARILNPVVAMLNASANGVLRIFGVQPKTEATSVFTLDEVATIVATSTREGVLADSQGRISAAFDFTEKRVSDVQITLPELVTLPEDASPADVERAVAKHGFSRYVLTNPTGEPTGYVHIKDVIDLDAPTERDASADASAGEWDEPLPPRRIRRLISIPQNTDLEDALATLRQTGGHIARTADDEGNTTGVLFLEDIIEELVGEVDDATRRGRFRG